MSNVKNSEMANNSNSFSAGFDLTDLLSSICPKKPRVPPLNGTFERNAKHFAAMLNRVTTKHKGDMT